MFTCNACHGEIIPKNRFSVLIECPYCHTTYRKSESLYTQTGEVASLPPDMSFIQIGTTGQYEGKFFTVIGRIKVAWVDGNWSEWLLMFDDNTLGWLGDFLGRFSVSFPEKLEHDINIADLTTDQVIDLFPIPMTVKDIKSITYVGFEGELPFERQEGKTAISIDLASEGEGCAFMDNFDNNNNLYVGKWVNADELNLSNIRLLDGW